MSITFFSGENFTGEALTIKNTTPQALLPDMLSSNRDAGIHVNLKGDQTRSRFEGRVNSVICQCDLSATRAGTSLGRYISSSP